MRKDLTRPTHPPPSYTYLSDPGTDASRHDNMRSDCRRDAANQASFQVLTECSVSRVGRAAKEVVMGKCGHTTVTATTSTDINTTPHLTITVHNQVRSL